MKLTKKQIKEIEKLTGFKYNDDHDCFISTVFYSSIDIYEDGEILFTGFIPTEWLIPLGKILEGK